MSSASPDPIRFRCPTCKATVEAPLSRAGRRARCPCGQKVLVPVPPAVLNKTVLGELIPASQGGGDEVFLLPLQQPPAMPPPLPTMKKGWLRVLPTTWVSIIGSALIVGGIIGTICFLCKDTVVFVSNRPHYSAPRYSAPPSNISGDEYHDRLTEASLDSGGDSGGWESGGSWASDPELMDSRRNGLIVSLASVGFGLATLALGLWQKKR